LSPRLLCLITLAAFIILFKTTLKQAPFFSPPSAVETPKDKQMHTILVNKIIMIGGEIMSLNHSNCSVFEIFLGVLVGLIWFLVGALGLVAGVLDGLLGGAAAGTIGVIVAVIGLIILLLLGYCILRKVWGCCFGRSC
jgi:uncharacterized membrane protein